jgi:uncharacterized oxidoreductase
VQAFEPRGTVIERCYGGDQRFYLDRTRSQQLNRFRIFARGGAGALQANLTADDFLERKGDLRRDVADQRDSAAFANAVDRGGDGFRSSHSFEGNVDANSVGEFQDLRDEIGFGGEGFGRTEFLGHFEPGFVQVGDEHARATGGAQRLKDEKTDHSCPDHQRGVVWMHLRNADGVKGDGDSFEHGGLGEGKLIGEVMHDASGDDDVFGEGPGAAIIAAGDAEDLAIVAEVDISTKAVWTRAAVDRGVEGDAVAFRETCDIFADGGDSAGRFVTHHNRGDAAAGRTVVAVDIAAADAAGGDLNQDFIEPRGGFRKIRNFKVLVFGKEKSFHACGLHLPRKNRSNRSVLHFNAHALLSETRGIPVAGSGRTAAAGPIVLNRRLDHCAAVKVRRSGSVHLTIRVRRTIMQITGNTILITGGGSGIGRALAEAFHKEGNQVVIAGRRKQVLDETIAANPGMKAAILDIENAGAIRSFAKKLRDDYPALNVVVHNAGIMKPELLQDGVVDDAEATIATNLLGPLRLTAALLPLLLKQPKATIMTVSSGLAFVPMAMTPTYCATKAALHSYTQSLRYQLRNSLVQVLELIPPYVQTELGGARQASDPSAMPLKDFIAETMHILKTSPDKTEICVELVKPLRFAEANGGYDAFFKKFNDAVTAAAAAH